jgi:hypothetical protein
VTAPKAERAETTIQVLILLFVAGMAGAASFTHVHDWTMHNVPPGTGTWFGWANAIITELVPAATGIEIRRRKRQHRPVTYPMIILIIDAGVSLAAQLSDALHTLAGGLAFALPALAFLALTKLILSSTTTPGEQPCAATASKDVLTQLITAPAHATTRTSTTTSAPTADGPAPTPTAAPAASTLTPDRLRDLKPVPSGQLLISARMTAFAHQQDTGQPITPGQLADRLGVLPALAESLLDHLGGDPTPPPVTAANGIPYPESRP